MRMPGHAARWHDGRPFAAEDDDFDARFATDAEPAATDAEPESVAAGYTLPLRHRPMVDAAVNRLQLALGGWGHATAAIADSTRAR